MSKASAYVKVCLAHSIMYSEVRSEALAINYRASRFESSFEIARFIETGEIELVEEE